MPFFFWRRKTRALCNYKLSILGRIADGETEAHRLRKLPLVKWLVSRRKCWLSQPITIHQHSSTRKGVPGRARHRTAAVSWGPSSEGPHFRLTRAQQQIIPTGWHQPQSAWTWRDMGLDEGSKGIFFFFSGEVTWVCIVYTTPSSNMASCTCLCDYKVQENRIEIRTPGPPAWHLDSNRWSWTRSASQTLLSQRTPLK